MAMLFFAAALPVAAKVEFPWNGNDASPAVNGVKLGDSEQKTLDKLGAPEGVLTAKDGDEILQYKSGGLEITADGKRVVAIKLTTPEAGSIDGIKVGDIARAVILKWGLPLGGEGPTARFGTPNWTISVRTADKESYIVEMTLALNRAKPASEKAPLNVWQVH
jgi:hypothetical protein